MSDNNTYNENSFNAKFAQIFQILDNQDKVLSKLDESMQTIISEVKYTNGKVSRHNEIIESIEKNLETVKKEIEPLKAFQVKAATIVMAILVVASFLSTPAMDIVHKIFTHAG